jgi:hypothetical protein
MITLQTFFPCHICANPILQLFSCFWEAKGISKQSGDAVSIRIMQRRMYWEDGLNMTSVKVPLSRMLPGDAKENHEGYRIHRLLISSIGRYSLVNLLGPLK